MSNKLQDSQSELEKQVLKVIEHGTLEEHTQVELIMGHIEAYVTTRVKEAERLARIDELTKTYTQVIGDKETPSSRYSKVTRIFNKYLYKRHAELEDLTTTANGKEE